MAEGDQLTWGGIKGWAAANSIQDDAVVLLDIDDDEHPAVDIDSAPAQGADESDDGQPHPATLSFKSVYG